MLFCTHGAFTATHHSLGYKANLKKFKRTEIIQNAFSEHNETKLEKNERIYLSWYRHLPKKHINNAFDC